MVAKKTAASKRSESNTKDVSLNDLEKDLNKGNEAVQDYLTKQAIKQGAYFEGEKSSEQNKSDDTKTSADLSALEVAEKAVKK